MFQMAHGTVFRAGHGHDISQEARVDCLTRKQTMLYAEFAKPVTTSELQEYVCEQRQRL